MNGFSFAGTGHSGLDLIIDHLRLGDNVVWQTESIKDYKSYARAFAKKSISDSRKVVYIRYAKHEDLLSGIKEVKRYELDPAEGFEGFTIKIHNIINNEGVLAFYVFDCISALFDAWASDLMISRFFKIACKYMYELDCITYFALMRNRHSHQAFTEIRDCAQVVFDLYNVENTIYIHPLKVDGRYSSTMFMPHLKSGVDMIPLTSSAETSHLFSTLSAQSIHFAGGSLDNWDRMLIKASDLTLIKDKTDEIKKEKNEMFEKLLHLIMGKDEKMLSLARKYLTLEDLNEAAQRLVSSGFIGGKAAGMLIARKILATDANGTWKDVLESHDSYYVGSDVFYAYIIDNALWPLYQKHKQKEYFFDAAKELQDKFLTGSFSADIKERLIRILQYFGQSPIIIRSSSLLEDSYGNAFAGKYESYFLVNQGTLENRYIALEDAIRKIYSSTMGIDALTYRKKRGLEEKDEQMSLLIQRVSGDYHGKYFFPLLAGVGLSQNTYVWDKDMSRSAGLIRLVFGLGTRAVNRIENDYSRIIALDYPKKQLVYNAGDTKKYSQHFSDVLDTESNEFVSVDANDLFDEKYNIDSSLIAVPDFESNRLSKELGIQDKKYWVINYENLIDQTPFISLMGQMMHTIEKAYGCPVDIEFTANFTENNKMNINLLQCRPFQTKGFKKTAGMPKNIPTSKTLFKCEGNFMGGNIYQNIKRIICIDPEKYVELSESDKYGVARAIGQITNLNKKTDEYATMAIAPGRWGTTTASLGIPVSFSEINNISVLCEREFKSGGMTPELSFGSHFFQDLVEENIFYTALFSDKEDSFFNEDIIKNEKNLLPGILPEEKRYAGVIKVIDPENMMIISDIVSNHVICFLS